jgi:hypothetical protein
MLRIQKLSFSGQARTRTLVLALLATASGLLFAQPARAGDITVASPTNGATTASPVWVRAHNVGCNGLQPTAFGYSIDSSGALAAGVTPYDIDVTTQGIANGTHTIHFKSWTSYGICPVVDTTFTVGGGTSPSASSIGSSPSTAYTTASIPSYAKSAGDMDSQYWKFEHDGGTPGWSSGSTSYPASAGGWGAVRQFYMSYSNHGGERWHVSTSSAGDTNNIVLDTYILITDPGQVQNLELDVNQVLSSGETLIYGTQCSSISGTWEWAYVSGGPHWHNSNIRCNPRNWSANTWHHVQIGMHRSGANVIHDYVNLDGAHSTFSGAYGNGGMWLGWAKGALVTNYQIDGYNGGGGSVNSFINNMTVYHW